MTRYVKRGGNIWVAFSPHKPKKAAETRMGSGRGVPAAVIKPGRIIFEMAGVTKAEAFEALRLANNKLPVKRKAISRESSKSSRRRPSST